MKFLSAICHDALHENPTALSCIGMGVVLILAIFSQSNGSYLQTRTDREMTFGYPWTVRLFFASLLGWLVFACPTMALQGRAFPWWPVLLASGATVIGVFRLFSSNQVTFDTRGHHYHSVSFWSRKRRVRSGTYDDLKGIRIKHVTVKGSNFYSIGLAWNDDSGELWPLGRFSKRERANAFASELCQTLGLPLVEAPKQPKYRKSMF